MLAEGLGVEYDDLVSISMTGLLGRISELFFSSSVLGSFPFQFLGSHLKNVVEKINQTCERCPLDNSQCSVRTAARSVFIQEEKEKIMNRTLKNLVTDYRAKSLKI